MHPQRAWLGRLAVRLAWSSTLAAAVVIVLAGRAVAAEPLGETLGSLTDPVTSGQAAEGVVRTLQPVVEPFPALETAGTTLEPIGGAALEPVAPIVEPVLGGLGPIGEAVEPIVGPILDADAPPATELPLRELPLPGISPLEPAPNAASPTEGAASRDPATRHRSPSPLDPPGAAAAAATPDAGDVGALTGLPAPGTTQVTAAGPASAVDRSGVLGPLIRRAGLGSATAASLGAAGGPILWLAALAMLVLPFVRTSRLLDLGLTLPDGRLVLTPAPPG